MMINLPRLHIKKISGLESSSHSSAVSSASSFRKPEFSKDCNYGEHRRLHPKTHVQGSSHHIKKDSFESQHDTGSSTTFASDVDHIVKGVKFEKTARIRRVRPRHQYSKKEQEDMWYNESEYNEIKRRAVETVKRMIKGEKLGGFVDDDDYTARGLECRMKKNAVERKEFKAYARGLVLGEQEDQNDKGIKCSGKIRKVYLKASSISSLKAQDAGRRDAEAVNGISLGEVLRIIHHEHNLL